MKETQERRSQRRKSIVCNQEKKKRIPLQLGVINESKMHAGYGNIDTRWLIVLTIIRERETVMQETKTKAI